MSSLAPDAIEVAIDAWELAGRGAVGRVLEVGAELAPDRERWIGRTVALPGLRACGACLPCRRGHPARCARPGTPSLAATDRLPARLAVAFDDTLRAPQPAHAIAALGGTALTAYAAVIRAGVEPNRAAVVLGRGPLPLFVAALVRDSAAPSPSV